MLVRNPARFRPSSNSLERQISVELLKTTNLLVSIGDLDGQALGEFEHDEVGECRVETVGNINRRPIFRVKAYGKKRFRR